MQVVPSSEAPTRDRQGLVAFLTRCQEVARRKKRFQVASISLSVKHISPLAVLQSIYEADDLHFYVERVADDEAVAGAEAVVDATFSGGDRFVKARRFAIEILDNCIAVGDLEAPFAGPHFFTAFTFSERAGPEPFPPATVFLPRWQVSCRRGRYGAVANVRVDDETSIEPLADRVWAAYSKFGAFDYNEEGVDSSGGAQKAKRTEIEPGAFREGVREALGEIAAGAYEKVVLARAIELSASKRWQPLSALNRLRERYSDCFAFSFGGRRGRSFVGASPERILKLENGRLLTEAIAGSAPRGATAREDARLGRALLESAKDLHEHRCVSDSIIRRLGRCGIEGRLHPGPSLLRLANLQHLKTLIDAEVGDEVHLLDILGELHPTPAVGGKPRPSAIGRIRELEKIDRGLYAGVVGWFNHRNEGEMVVAIRSALIDGERARLYAGAGIVEGSDPEVEYGETELKLNALLEILTL